MSSPYRTPAQKPAPHVESLRLRRYPLLVQLFILAWLPAAMLVTEEMYPSVELSCLEDRGAINCTLDFHTLARQWSRGVVAEPSSVWTDKEELVVTTDDENAYRFPLVFGAGSVEADFGRFLRARTDYSLHRTVRSIRWVSLLCGVAELLILAFYTTMQIRIRIDVDEDSDAGTIRIQRRRRFRGTETTTVDLADVNDFVAQDRDSNGRAQIVFATIRTNDEPRQKRLFDALNAEARRGLLFLQDARSRWLARQS